ncbi:hypothetical protein D3C59_33575 [Streptomyces sp. SHP22-7]|nr:hypothetical protein D3C59_33575 [Streptomyces sp. SHP22-7]
MQIDAFTLEALKTGVVGSSNLVAGSVTTAALAADSVTATAIAANAVTAAKIDAGAVTTGKLAAGAVTANEIAANAITAGKILAGSVDATALAADAITGKNITGGTITGSTIQTDISGERITLNEGDQNMILVYNTTEAIGEISARGLLLKGTSGAVMWLNPSTALPQMRFDNASGTNNAYVQMAEPTAGDANLQFVSGTFAGDGFTDRIWRQYMGNDFTIIERIRRGSSVAHRGGRINLRNDFAEIGYMDSASTANAGYLHHQAGVVSTKGRHTVEPQAASADPALSATAPSAHTGPLLRLSRDGDRFTVDKDGAVTVAGRVKPATGESASLALQSGWTNYDATNYGTATVRKTADGMAYLYGRLQAGTVTSGTLIATIPSGAGYWPLVRHAFPTAPPGRSRRHHPRLRNRGTPHLRHLRHHHQPVPVRHLLAHLVRSPPMATRYDTCPTCSTQTGVNVCDNCQQDIPVGTTPAVSGRVWNPNIEGYVGVDLCETCTAQDVNLLAVVTAPTTDQPTP